MAGDEARRVRYPIKEEGKWLEKIYKLSIKIS